MTRLAWSSGGSRVEEGRDGASASSRVWMRRAARATNGNVPMVSDTTARTPAATPLSISRSWVARPMPMKANSPPGASSRLVSMLVDHGTPNSRQSGASSSVLATIMARNPPATSSGSRQMKPRSMCMPTEKKKTPSRRPRKGSIIASTARRYSVSARSRPAMKAPSAIDRPATEAITPEPTAISRVAAMKNSGLSVLAASRNSGFSTTRPTTAITPTATSASTSAITTPCRTEPSEWPPKR